jgi:glycerophosphoryl diester phosphodiesterase
MSAWRIGHRGACGHAPENTLASFKKALEIGVDGFEFDIQLSKDGVPVIIHDATLERTTNGTGLVSDHTLAQLQTLDAGGGERILSLRDLLEFMSAQPNKTCRLFVELKAEESVPPVVELLSEYVNKRGWIWDRFLLCSFNHHQMFHARKLNPNIQTAALLVAIPMTLAALAVEAGACAVNPALDHTNQAFVDDAHTRGLKVLVWTVNKPEAIARARALGVDGIISDFPERLCID